MSTPRLVAVSDLHVNHPANRRIVAGLRPEREGDWLLVAGDVAHSIEDVDWTLRLLADRFAKVLWTVGNHELWTLPRDGRALRGERRYLHLVELCRSLGVVTPEDPYPIWETDGGQLAVAPLFVLFDYSLRPAGRSREEALARAVDAGVSCADEILLDHDPYPSREAWCRARVRYTQRRLEELPSGMRTVLVSHWPLHPGPTRRLRSPEFSIWCGTRLTEDWHRRYRAAVVVYGHLHIPLTDWYDGVALQEVSLGYPREWQPRDVLPADVLRTVPIAGAATFAAGARLGGR
jgi:3',5'-cyclic AMP phosphodiesterase CpdA